MSDPSFPSLANVDPETFWPRFRWTQFAAMPERDKTVVVIPIAGLADWGLGHSLDAEETVLMAILKAASQKFLPKSRLLVVPPLRFAFGADPACAFALDQVSAFTFLADVVSAIAGAGFKKVVFLNASPWSEELLIGASRDIRISLCVQTFVISLSALELDFHPTRSKSRRTLQTLLTALNETEAEAPEPLANEAPGWGDEPITPLQGPAEPLASARTKAPALIEAAGARLAVLLADIDARPLTLASLAYPTSP